MGPQKRVDLTHQNRLPANAHAHRDVFQARLPGQEMVKLNRGYNIYSSNPMPTPSNQLLARY